MNRFHTMFAIALSLIIGLGSVTAIAHSHADHEDTSCSVSVLQNSSAAVATEASRTFITRATTPSIVHASTAISNRIRGCQHARAPPHHL
ncbi:hypothetical protein N2382_03515 [SAR92 clade bacterium H921]|nr:hypothetical protein [SAR92 clade bacterium H921]MDG1308357.1 hypothetical protein [Porticoccaceae bacterium]